MSMPLRVLVAIANHGTKNQSYLTRLLDAYRAMEHEVDVVVLSDVDEDLGPDVEVRVGAPSEDPRSLPFAHRELFADRLEDYDLFIYSEDDTLVEQRHVDAFVELDALLPENEIPGFLRFEVHADGRPSYCSIHSFYRWRPESVGVRGGEVVATYTNDHAACYMLTRGQLRRAIASGGFLVEPHHGPYDMLVSAATDPYTRCGLQRRIVVTRIDDVLLAHLPNVYLGRLGVDEEELRTQVAALVDIAYGRRGPGQLLDLDTALASDEWGVPQHAIAGDDLRALVGPSPGRTLSIGCASGRLEESLRLDLDLVTGLPLDEVVGAVAASRGITVLPPDLAALDDLEPGAFDLVLVHQVLHHVPDPVALLRRLRRLLSAGGRLVLSVPNLRYERLRARAGRSTLDLPRRGFEVDGVHATTPATVRRWARAAGLELADARPELTAGVRRRAGFLEGVTPGWLGHTLHVELRPTPQRPSPPRRLPGLESPRREADAVPSSRGGKDGRVLLLLLAVVAGALAVGGTMVLALQPVDDPPASADGRAGNGSGGHDTAPHDLQIPGQHVGSETTGPDAAADEVRLRPSGSVTSEHDGEVISGLDVTGEIRIAHDDVVVEDVRLRTGDGPYGISYVADSGAHGARVERVEIDGGGNPEQIGVFLDDVHLRDSRIRGVRVGVQARSGALVEGNHIHDLAVGDETHGTAVSVHGGRGVIIRDNRLEGSTSAALSLYPRLAPIEDVLVEGNLFDGGSYCVYGGDVDKEYRERNRDIRFIGNAFGRSLHADCGIHGPVAAFDPTQPGNRWEDNVWADTGEQVR